MTKRILTAEEMRLKGLEMIRQAKEKERREREAIRLKLGELMEKQIETGFRDFDLALLVERVGEITGKQLAIVGISDDPLRSKSAEREVEP